MERKYFFFDIDGTLTERETGIAVPSALEAVRKLQEAGHFAAIATGRAFYKAEKFRRESGFQHMVCNGGHGIVIDGVLRENRPIDYKKALEIYQRAIGLGYGVLCAMDDSKSVYAKDLRFVQQCGPRKEPTTYFIDPDFDPAKADQIFKMYISVPKIEEERVLMGSDLGHMRFVPQYLMFQPDAKKEGILRMLELTGGRAEDVVVFGDDTNDLCMFDPMFTCVAMGNACEALKEKADWIAEANVDDGIYKICSRMGWF